MSHEHRREITNDNDGPLPIWIEPWAEEVQIPPRETFTFVARGDQPGELEFEETNSGIVLYGWPSSTLSVFHENKLVWQIDLAVPDIPAGMSMRSFVDAMFVDKKAKPDSAADSAS